MDKISYVLGFQKGLAAAHGSPGGGASTHPLHTVTFMSDDGAEVLYKRSVVDGDNCADVVARGLLAAPTKESTVDQVFTYTGWAATAGGAASSSALNAVVADRAVYAAYTSAVRYYTITYLDEDGTVLKTESLSYGTMPSYVATKDEYNLDAWVPEPVAVTGDASYTATWKAKPHFETATWAEISEITHAGTSANNFALGQTKREVLTYADGTTEDIEFVIAKIRDDGSMVLALTHALATPKQMCDTTPYEAAVVYNYLGKYLNNTILPALSQGLQAVLRDALTSVIHKGKIRLMTKENTQTGTQTGAYYESVPWLTTQANRVRKSNGTAVTYWTSSSKSENGVPKFYVINTDGTVRSEAVHPVNTHSVVFLIDV